MGFPRAGSNPAGCEIVLICFLTFYITLFFRVSNRKQKISLDCPDYAKTNTWYRHKNKSPSPPKSEPNRGSQKRYFIVSIANSLHTYAYVFKNKNKCTKLVPWDKSCNSMYRIMNCTIYSFLAYCDSYTIT